MKNFALIGASGYIAPRHLKAIKDTNNNFMNLDFSLLLKDKAVIYDVKNILPNSLADRTL